MKRDFLEKLGLDKDVIDQIMAENGRDIESEKNKRVSAEANAEALDKQLKTSQAELDKIQKSGANAEELKSKVYELQQKLEEDSKAHTKVDLEVMCQDTALDKVLGWREMLCSHSFYRRQKSML